MLLHKSHDLTTPRQSVLEVLSEFSRHKIETTSILQDQLDLVDKKRTPIFPWRGQFSPELIDYFLSEYASKADSILDPFVGSGTTLFESIFKQCHSYGAEINPAAFLMASSIKFSNIPLKKRKESFKKAKGVLTDWTAWEKILKHKSVFISSAKEFFDDPLFYNVLGNVLLRMGRAAETGKQIGSLSALYDHELLVDSLPFTETKVDLFHGDARRLPLMDSSIDLIITSPPYINVFNYHQNYRNVMELLGWDILEIAKSEFGSNRKNRGNRFLTVIQYILDMSESLYEMRRVMKAGGRLIMVVGRQSSVCKTPFHNGKIVAALGLGTVGLKLVLRQERKFKNKFGQIIFEDILHFEKGAGRIPGQDFSYALSEYVLLEAQNKCESLSIKADILSAIQEIPLIQPSPLYRKVA